MTDARKTMRLRVLASVRERLRGLLGSECDAEPVVLMRCSSIHTWGMRYAIDVALIARNGRVLKAIRAVPPKRLVSAVGAYYALERPASEEAWPTAGSWVSLAHVTT